MRVKEILTRKDISSGRKRVTGLVTECGATINSDVVVLCAGQWTRQLAAKCNVNVPLHSAEHFYVITKPIEGVDSNLCVMRDPDV